MSGSDLALGVVVLVGGYLFALGAVSLVAPRRASRFLLGFAGSPTVNFAELGLRFIAGASFILCAPRMALPGAFSLFGWVLVGTTAALLVIPWRWHHRFARRAVPLFTSRIGWVGLASVAFGCLILWAVIRGNAS